jgi:hypothetical protein
MHKNLLFVLLFPQLLEPACMTFHKKAHLTSTRARIANSCTKLLSYYYDTPHYHEKKTFLPRLQSESYFALLSLHVPCPPRCHIDMVCDSKVTQFHSSAHRCEFSVMFLFQLGQASPQLLFSCLNQQATTLSLNVWSSTTTNRPNR